MPELNFDKVLASLKLRLDEVVDESEFDEILKEYAGKESLLSAERKNLSNLSNEDKKVYGETLNNVNKSIVTNIKKAKEKFISNKYASLEDEENEDIKLHLVSSDDAIALLKNDVENASTIMGLQWFALNKNDLVTRWCA